MSSDRPSEPSASFTGIRRQRTTRPSVLVADRAARSLITIGGIGTILSVLGVALFLIWVVLPLFLPSKIDRFVGTPAAESVLQVGSDEYRVLGWRFTPRGAFEVFRLDTGVTRSTLEPFTDGEVTVGSFPIRGDQSAIGMSDGTVNLLEVGFDASVLDAEDLPVGITAAADEGEIVDYRDGVVELTPAGQYRFQHLVVETGASARISTGAIRSIDHIESGSSTLVVVLADGELDEAPSLIAVRFFEDSDFMTGETTIKVGEAVKVPYTADRPEPPLQVVLGSAGTELYIVWRDGYLERLDVRDLASVRMAERGRLPADGEIEFFRPLLGGTTFLWGDSNGTVSGGFPVRLSDADRELPILHDVVRHPEETHAFVRTKELARASAPALSMASSARSRLAAVGFGDGEIRLFNITNSAHVATARLPEASAVLSLLMTPKEDGLLAVTGDRIYSADLDPRYPEAGFSAFFRPVWYEGYAQPQHTWQSSSGTDDFEMKLGLMPLIFGTLKATLYSMLIGAPLALLAAVFTSEFLSGRTRSVVKPAIELMASLPSVVLGFLAALVIAPFVEKVVPATLAAFVTVPLSFLLGAQLWQLLSSNRSVRWQKFRLPAIFVTIPIGILLAVWTGPAIESIFFAGDFTQWLSWDPANAERLRYANPLGGWLFICFPLSAVLVLVGGSRLIGNKWREMSAVWDRRQYAIFDLFKLLAGFALAVGLAIFVSWLLATLGFDARGGLIDTYQQRNALIVGFIMGFAIIPIIYTISEDALQAVPEHLRSASLGAGATTWQTAVRIIIPTAMSGLFSALMVGLGRAVGETMIVLMAAGNTPVMEWNIFEGFRTLSANIAVELPEAVRGSTHYRTLFLAALVLFGVTFVVNTIAETIRLRFRKKAYQL